MSETIVRTSRLRPSLGSRSAVMVVEVSVAGVVVLADNDVKSRAEEVDFNALEIPLPLRVHAAD